MVALAGRSYQDRENTPHPPPPQPPKPTASKNSPTTISTRLILRFMRLILLGG